MRAAPMRSAAGCRRVGGAMAMMREIHGCGRQCEWHLTQYTRMLSKPLSTVGSCI